MDDEQDIKQRKQAIENEHLERLWDIFEQGIDLSIGPDLEDVHMRPALVWLIRDLGEDKFKEAVQKALRDKVSVEYALSMLMGNLIVDMFRFGQFCMQLPKPLTYESLTPCSCGDLTQDDIDELLGRKGE